MAEVGGERVGEGVVDDRMMIIDAFLASLTSERKKSELSCEVVDFQAFCRCGQHTRAPQARYYGGPVQKARKSRGRDNHQK